MKLSLQFLAISLCFYGLGENDHPYGQFKILNIDHTQYKGGAQLWDIIQNQDNFIGVANGVRILEFNDEQWTRFELENDEQFHLFDMNENGDIYVGGRGEFVVIKNDERGCLYSEKIFHEIDSLDFKDPWKFFCIKEKTYFVAGEYVFILGSSGIELIKTPETAVLKGV